MVAQEWRNCGNECRIPSTLKYIWSPLNCASPNFPSCTFVFGRWTDGQKERSSFEIGENWESNEGEGCFWLGWILIATRYAFKLHLWITNDAWIIVVFRLSLLRVSFVVVCFSSYSRLVKKFESFLCMIFRGEGLEIGLLKWIWL